MTGMRPTTGDLKRRDIVLRLGAITLLGIGLSLSAHLSRSGAGPGQSKSGKLFPRLARDLSKVSRIEILGPSNQFELVKVSGTWVMPLADSHAIAEAPLRRLLKAVSDLRYVRALPPPTQQDAAASQIDPRTGGDGVWLSLETDAREKLATLIVARRGDRTLVLLSDDTTLYEVTSADWPSLTSASAWLDLPHFDIPPERIATISLTRTGQGPIDIVRRPDGGFAPVGGSANASITDIALVLTRLAFQDARRESRMIGPASFRHETSLKSGLILALEGYEADGQFWVKVRVDASKAATDEEGQRLTEATRGWAYQVQPKLGTLLSTPTALLLQAGP
ncbi:hypothetical protein [Aquidulcibacter sp.]|uniref:hypothetical protein n=1 Tax=Aquidulcibacter sp. TaxID=2052990 RepID=UPI0025C47A36|nr:hypothetical protein [Aquidulcibacter sp.]MCA3693131.1 hypothetical protein [Aquidulcibacter sp.]